MPSILRRTLIAFASLAALVIAAPVHIRAQQAPVTLAGYPAPNAPATVVLSSPGAEPRTPLRYKVTAGQKCSMEMSTVVSVTVSMEAMSMPAMDLPTMKMTADLVVKDVAANGDITYDLAFTGMTAEAQPGMDPSMVAMMQGAAGDITKLKGTVTVSNRGVTKATALDLNAVTDPNLKQVLNQMSGPIQNISMPLPEEAVGVGAKWEVRQAVNAAGIQSFQRNEMEIVKIDGTSVTLRAKSEQTAPAQTVANPMMAGATMDVEKMSGTGTGTIVLRLDGLVPTSETSIDSLASMTMNMGGQAQKLGLAMKMKMSVAPKK